MNHTCAGQYTNLVEFRLYGFQSRIAVIARDPRLGRSVAHACPSFSRFIPEAFVSLRGVRPVWFRHNDLSIGSAVLVHCALTWIWWRSLVAIRSPLTAPPSPFASRPALRSSAPIDNLVSLNASICSAQSVTHASSRHSHPASLADHDAARQPVAAPPVLDADRTINAQQQRPRRHSSLNEQ